MTANLPVPKAPPWPPPPLAGPAGQLIVGSDGEEKSRATSGARNDEYATLMAKMFPPNKAKDEDDDYWLQPRPPLCPGWGVEEWAGNEDDDCPPLTEEDWDEAPPGSGGPRLQGAHDEAEEDSESESEQLLRDLRALRDAAEAKQRAIQDENRKTEEELVTMRKPAEERREREEDEREARWKQIEELLSARSPQPRVGLPRPPWSPLPLPGPP